MNSTPTPATPKSKDRLTQLQICFDQMMEQFCATLNYVDKNHILNEQPQDQDQQQQQTSPSGDALAEKTAQDGGVNSTKSSTENESFNHEEFESTIHELSNDLILKTRQILKLIDSLPGIDASSDEQMTKIDRLSKELMQVEQEKLQVIKEKDNILMTVTDLIDDFTSNKKTINTAVPTFNERQ
ncbi:hypothetical protein ACO0QE_000540 [Hanseniaspora vineae]